MIKTIYFSAWTLVAVSALILGLTENLNYASQVILSLVVLALFYAFALRTVVVNTREP
jgi:hypothetical protein